MVVDREGLDRSVPFRLRCRLADLRRIGPALVVPQRV